MLGLGGSLPSLGGMRNGLGQSVAADPITNPRHMGGYFGGGSDVMESLQWQNNELRGMANDPTAGSMQRVAGFGPFRQAQSFNYGGG